jgi:hypothetical protein
MEIHHGWTLWFQNKKTNGRGANVSPIIIHLFEILQNPNQMWITMEENLRLVILFDYRNLGLLDKANHLPINISSISDMKHPMCQP